VKSAICVIAVMVAVQRRPLDDVRRELQAAYDRASAASIAARTLTDFEAIHEWLDTPDCRFKEFGQPFRTWSEMRRYAELGLHTPIISFASTIQTIEMRGDAAVATTLVRGVARIIDQEGRFGRKGAAHDVETTATVRDTWVKSDHWRRKEHEKIAANAVTKVDGKPVHP
jgi:hypothetical protein